MIIKIDRGKRMPIYRQISDYIYSLIVSGHLATGSRLPDTRSLANSLGVSRNTVVYAYRELEARGLIYAHVGKGTFIQKYLPKGIFGTIRKEKSDNNYEGFYSSAWRNSYKPTVSVPEYFTETNPPIISFTSDLPSPALLPFKEFRDCLQSAMRKFGPDLLASGQPMGFQPLLDYLPTFLAKRNIQCENNELMIVNGVQQGLSIVGRLFVDPGDNVVLENLTYPGALLVFKSLQSNCVGVPLDTNGIRVDILENIFKLRKIKLLYIIPTYQNPTGTVLSLDRRKRLLELCREHQVIIVEDDYAHELYLDGKETLPLKAWDEHNNVIYMGSFSNILFPGIRLSWILAPSTILEKLIKIKQTSDLFTNPLLQAALVQFCCRGWLDRHLKKLRLIYRKRRDVMLEAMKNHFPSEVSWQKPTGGLFQWVDLPSEADTTTILKKSTKDGVIFTPDSGFSVEEWTRRGMRMSFSNEGEENIQRGIYVISTILKKSLEKEV